MNVFCVLFAVVSASVKIVSVSMKFFSVFAKFFSVFSETISVSMKFFSVTILRRGDSVIKGLLLRFSNP